jgi:putative ABC transport system permease protein
MAAQQPDWLAEIRRRIAPLRLSPAREASVISELAQHLGEHYADLLSDGASGDHARATVLAGLDDHELLREMRALPADELAITSGRSTGKLWDDFRFDLSFGLRLLRKNPGFATIAILTLALGIGANAAMFTAVDAVLLRPLPFKDAGRLVLVSEYRPGNVNKTGSPLTRYRTRAAENTVFEQTAGYWDVSGGNGLVFGASDSVERLRFSVVTASFFSILGIQPAIGRSFSPAEERPGGAKVFLASDALWHGLLGGDRAALGNSFRLDGEPYTLIGVLPPRFQFPGTCDVWIPIGTLGTWPEADRVSHQFWMIGRLRRGISVAQAQAQLDGIQQRLGEAYPATDANWRVAVGPLLEEFVGNVRRLLWMLFAAVAFVLLIACTNIVNLLLARVVSREKEFAIRAALGARRRRLVQQALTEALLIVMAGTAAALVLTKLGLRAIVTFAGGTIPRLAEASVNTAVLGFCLVMALVITFLIGLAPGLHASNIAFTESLQAGQRSGAVSRRGRGSRNLLVVFEVALTVLLLAGAGLMLRSFQQLRNVDPGFHPERLATLKTALPASLYPKPEQRSAFLQALLQRLNSTPGITTAAATDRLPLSGDRNWGAINIVGHPLLDSAHAPVVEGRAVSANYFRTVGVPVLRGRDFTEADVAQNHPVVVINEAMAEKFWPGQDPLGQRVASPYRPGDPPREIIGVVGNVKDFALDADSPPEMYSTVRAWNEMNLVLRSSLDLQSLTAAVTAQVAGLDRNVPVYGARTLEELVSGSIARQKLELWLLAIFASIALVLAAVGIYGVVAFTVSGRTHEIGVRLALGATHLRTVGLVVGQGMKPVVFGLAAGTVLSLLLIQLIRGFLFNVSPEDPLTFVAVGVVLIFAGTLACLLPARRAMRVDPAVALRAE